MKKLLVVLLFFFAALNARAQVTPPAGQITAATTNATCVGGTPNGGAVDLTLAPTTGTVGISVTGTWSATLNIQLSTDHGRTWTASGGTFTANQQSIVGVAGNSDVCVFASAYTSGTAQITFTQSTATLSAGGTGTSASQVQGTAANGAAQVGNPVLIAGLGTGSVIQPFSTTGAGDVSLGAAAAASDGASNSFALIPGGRGAGPSSGLVILPYVFNGTTWDRALTCSNTSTFSVASTTTQVIAASGSTKIRICSFDINPATITAGSTDIVYGTGTNCGTGTTTLTGAYTLPASAVVDITPATLSATSPLTTPASQAVCVRAVTSTVNGFIVWEQH